MCPDDPVLSSYLDHELALGVSEEVEAHLADCDHCRNRLRRYQSVAHGLLECEEPDVEEAGMRIWQRIDALAPVAARPRRVSLRLPVAAASMAAAIAIVFTVALGDRPAAGLLGRLPELSRNSGAPGDPAPQFAGADRSAVLELALPDAGQFQLFSAPAILHEVELQPSAAAALGDPVTMEVQLPPARYRLVGMPVIVHEAELETPNR